MTLHDLKIACPAYNMLAPDGICERCRGGKLHNVLTNRCIKGSAALSAVVMAEAIVHRLLGSYRNCVSRFAVPSRFYIQKLTEWGTPAELFSHVPNFVDAGRYHPNYRPGDAFVFFGRLSREKGVATLIRAAAEAGVRLVIAGTGPQLPELQDVAARTRANVEFLGYLAGDALHQVVKEARAVVLPSEWYENAPMSVLEAYALGKPVLGARIGGIPELIVENETGSTFESGDVASLAAALRRVANTPDEDIAAMGRRARGWVESEFTAELYRERLLAIYHDLGVKTGSLSSQAPM
jgi:glycosyltransferase involved in cell wall biosynthesis